MNSKPSYLFAVACLVLSGCVEENATVLTGTGVETGAPGEFFVPGRARSVMRCVFAEDGVSGTMIDYPIVEGGEILGTGGWRATFGEVDYNRIRVVVRDRSGNADPELNNSMREWLHECS